MLAFQNNTKQQKKILNLVMGIMRRGAWKKWIWLFFLIRLRDSCTSLLLHYLPSFWSHQVAIKQGMFPATQVSTKLNQQQHHSTSKKIEQEQKLALHNYHIMPTPKNCYISHLFRMTYEASSSLSKKFMMGQNKLHVFI